MTSSRASLKPVSRAQTWLPQKKTPEAIERFLKRDYYQDHYKHLAIRARDLCKERIEEEKKNGEGIQATVSCREKDIDSLREKLKMRNEERLRKGGKEYENSDQIREDIVDLAGVRIIMYMPSEGQRQKVKHMIEDLFDDVTPKVHDGSQTGAEESRDYRPRHLGYTAEHYRATMKETPTVGNYAWKEYDRVEIQVVSALANAWAQAGHDILYKTYAFGRPTLEEQRILDALNGIVLSGDVLLEQFHELVRKRTYKPFETRNELGTFLDGLDLLQDEDEYPQLDGDFDVLLGFLKAENKNYPLHVRTAIKELGYPLEPKLYEVQQTFLPCFEPKESMLAFVCLIRHMISPPSPLNNQVFVSPRDKCQVMMNALTLLQDFSPGNEAANKFLRELINKGTIKDKEKVGLNFVLTSSYRQVILDGKGNADELEPAWKWFQGRAQDENCICGLVFRLAEMGAVKDVGIDKLVLRLNIGSLFDDCTSSDSEGP